MKIGIFAAEQQEIEIIQQKLCGKQTEKAGMTFYESSYGKHTVIAVCGGIGKVAAALCTQILISEFKAERMINTGTAGGLNPALHIFDLVVSTDAVQHDVNACVFGYKRGQIPNTLSPFWKADTAMRDCALQTFARMKEEKHPLLQSSTTAIHTGRIASGDTFITDTQEKNELICTFAADCVEMEGAAVAHVCSVNAVPFLILRCISDNAGEPAAVSYQEFSKKASEISALLVLELLKNL